jgi:hypothetical protein
MYAIQNGGFSGAYMPQNVVVGKDAVEVARFVATYAGRQAPKLIGVVKCQSMPIGSLPTGTPGLAAANAPTASAPTATTAATTSVTTAASASPAPGSKVGALVAEGQPSSTSG